MMSPLVLQRMLRTLVYLLIRNYRGIDTLDMSHQGHTIEIVASTISMVTPNTRRLIGLNKIKDRRSVSIYT